MIGVCLLLNDGTLLSMDKWQTENMSEVRSSVNNDKELALGEINQEIRDRLSTVREDESIEVYLKSTNCFA